ncbi:MAG: hypothetical protein ACTSU2_04625 [Promethearchaeota archaeon]
MKAKINKISQKKTMNRSNGARINSEEEILLDQEDIEILNEQLNLIYDYLSNKRVVIGFTGGLNSLVLLKMAERSAKDIICVFVDTDYVSPSDRIAVDNLRQTNDYKNKIKVLYRNGLASDFLILNSEERDFFCKKAIADVLEQYRNENNYDLVIDGTCFEDYRDFWGVKNRFGDNYKMIFGELEVTSKAIQLFAQKNKIEFNREHEINLLSRFVYNIPITKDLLKSIVQSEIFVKTLHPQINLVRVRILDQKHVIIEVPRDKIEYLVTLESREKIYNYFSTLGFESINIDLSGYRMNNLFKHA